MVPSVFLAASPLSRLSVSLLAAVSWIHLTSAAPPTDPSDVPHAAATDIVSPIPAVPPPSSSGTHLTTYGILGIVISGVLVATAAIGYGLRHWKRYKRSRLPPSAQYRESLRVAAREAAEAVQIAEQGAPLQTSAQTPSTREVAGAGVVGGVRGTGGAGKTEGKVAEGPSISSRVKDGSSASRSPSGRESAGAGRRGSSRRQSKSEKINVQTQATKSGKPSDGASPGPGPGPSSTQGESRCWTKGSCIC